MLDAHRRINGVFLGCCCISRASIQISSIEGMCRIPQLFFLFYQVALNYYLTSSRQE